MPLDPGQFRATLSRLASGVTIVAVRAPGGGVLAMTASSVCSLSLEPPMVLVCVGREASIHDALAAADSFAIHVLAADQEQVARHFALSNCGPLAETMPATPGGLPLLTGALASLECRRAAVHAGGDHSIITGIVEWSRYEAGAPLCYFRSEYTTVAR